jgi:hypothetical protein
MARLRFMAVALLALTLAGNPTQTGRSAGQTDLSVSSAQTATTKTSAASDHTRVLYSLTSMGYDADLGKWIAQTIPEMIEPNSWQEKGGSGVLRYYGPKNLLIIKQSAAVQAKVDSFLKELKSSLPKASRTNSAASKPSSRGHVVPAEYREPTLVRTSGSVPEPSSYPVPAPAKPPKHLFHFLIRYEGEGLIDDNVVKFMKGYAQVLKDESKKEGVQSTYSPATPVTRPPVVEDKKGPASSISSDGPVPVTRPPVAEDKKEDQKEKSGQESP